MRGFHRDRDRQHSGRREHDERQGRPTRQMRGREIKTRRKKEVGEAKKERHWTKRDVEKELGVGQKKGTASDSEREGRGYR